MTITTKYDEAKAKRPHSEPRPDILFTFGPWIRGDNRAPDRGKAAELRYGLGGWSNDYPRRSSFGVLICFLSLRYPGFEYGHLGLISQFRAIEISKGCITAWQP
jgi:hypothetical protein